MIQEETNMKDEDGDSVVNVSAFNRASTLSKKLTLNRLSELEDIPEDVKGEKTERDAMAELQEMKEVKM